MKAEMKDKEDFFCILYPASFIHSSLGKGEEMPCGLLLPQDGLTVAFFKTADWLPSVILGA